MSFADHLEANQDSDGVFDLAAAEEARAAEILSDGTAVETLARKAAASERANWARSSSTRMRKELQGGQLSLGLDLDVVIPLGKSKAVPLGKMNRERIRARKDLRTDSHIAESEAFTAEMRFWEKALSVLGPDQTLADLQEADAGEES